LQAPRSLNDLTGCRSSRLRRMVLLAASLHMRRQGRSCQNLTGGRPKQQQRHGPAAEFSPT
jgi:hypothetical protein